MKIKSGPALFGCVFLLIFLAYEAGRGTVHFAVGEKRTDESTAPHAAELSIDTSVSEQNDVTFRNVATVPFSELYDVLRAASSDQLHAWAEDLEKMRDGPRRRAAVTAFYRSLVQVNTKAAIDTILRAKNLRVRDIAVMAVLDAAPESEWGNLAEMMEVLPHPRRPFVSEQDLLWNWSRVDPRSAAEFVERHPAKDPEDDESYYRVFCNWGEIDPAAMKAWFESHPYAQTSEGVRGLLSGWESKDRAGAIAYAIAMSGKPNFEKGIQELAYTVLRDAPNQATSFILQLPQQLAQNVVHDIARTTTGVILGIPEGYQKPSDEVARWMINLPSDLWKSDIGSVVWEWDRRDSDGFSRWISQLPTETHDLVLANFCGIESLDYKWEESAHSRQQLQDTLLLSLTIQNTALRDSALSKFAKQLAENRSKVIAVVDELSIKSRDKAYLRKMIATEPK